MDSNVMFLDLYTLCYASVQVNLRDNLKEKSGGRGDIYVRTPVSPIFLIYIDIIDLYYMLL